MSDKTDIKSMTLPELEVFTTEVMGEKKDACASGRFLR